MKYQKPYDQTDPNASYVNGNPASGIQGSIPPAEAIEQPQREIVNAITAAGLTPNNTDMTQLAQAIGHGSIYYAADTTNTNSYAGTLVPAITTWTDGMTIDLKVSHANTAASSYGGVSILRADGSALQPGDIAASTGPYHARLVFDLAGNKLLLQNPATLMQSRQLSAATSTFYVNGATGNDANPGSSALPFATLQGAVTYISQFLSTSAVTVNVAAGTYAGVKIPPSFISGWNFVGAGVSTCTINGTTTSLSQGRAVLTGYNTNVTMSGFSFASNYENINVQPGGSLILNNCNCSAPATSAAAIASYGYCQLMGAINFASGTYTAFLFALVGGNIRVGYHDSFLSQPATLNFGTSTVSAGTVMSMQDASVSFDPSTVTQSGTVTGPKFSATYGGSISTNGSGVNYLLGSTAGNAPTGYYF